jgi:hypothetical protein
VENLLSVTALARCDDSMAEWLQKLGGGGQMLSLDNWMGKTQNLQMPWGIIKDN